ncbi:MAG: DegT/DnrJ/EryC1/StrS family aminotransferase [Candidatus Sericytochromatia bacterium]
MIQILDLKQQYLSLEKEIDKAVKEVLLSTNFIGGTHVETLEKEIAEFCNVKHGVALNSGTDALFLALRACGIKAGDEIITTPFTFIATTETIGAIGANPVFIDIDPRTYNIDVEKIEEKITSKTKAIMPVHLFGQAARMDRIMEIAKKHNLFVIEDCAQSINASFKGQKTGSIGDMGCFSFFPSKNLGAYGDGGMLISNNSELSDKAKVIRQHGSRVKYYHEELGVNSRLDAIQAAILRIKLPHLNKWTENRRNIAKKYTEKLNDLKEHLTTPFDIEESYSVYHQYTLSIHNGKRDELQNYLKDNGIQTMIYYPVPLHLQEVHANLGYKEGDFPNSEKAAKEVLSLPMFPELTEEQQNLIVEKIYSFFK